MSNRLLLASLSTRVFSPATALACACGCGVFDVGTGTMMPADAAGTVWLEYDYMEQNVNWRGTGRLNPANNSDNETVNDFFSAGGQYMFDRSWGQRSKFPT
jgi:hypothetical protein